LTGRGVLRPHQSVLADGRVVGEVTSGGFSPTLERSIAFARVEPGTPADCAVDIRGKPVSARIVKPPFVRNGRILHRPLTHVVRLKPASRVKCVICSLCRARGLFRPFLKCALESKIF
jgi:hypothetical protein